MFVITGIGGYIQMKHILDIPDLKITYFIAPVLLSIVFGSMTSLPDTVVKSLLFLLLERLYLMLYIFLLDQRKKLARH